MKLQPERGTPVTGQIISVSMGDCQQSTGSREFAVSVERGIVSRIREHESTMSVVKRLHAATVFLDPIQAENPYGLSVHQNRDRGSRLQRRLRPGNGPAKYGTIVHAPVRRGKNILPKAARNTARTGSVNLSLPWTNRR